MTQLPPGAVLLASSRAYPHQAFRLVPCAWGLQYHPEVTREGFAVWVREGHAAVTAAGLDPDGVLAGFDRCESALAAAAIRHAEAFAGVLAARTAAAAGA